MSQNTDSKFIQEFQTKLDDMTKSNSTVNQKILSDLRDIQGKVSTILENIKSLKKKIVECNQKTNDVSKQIQQNNQSIQSSAPPGQIAELQKQNAELKQQLSVIDQTKKQAIDAIQKSIVVLDNYRNSSDTDVNSIKGLIDEIKAALMTASTAATTGESGESGGLVSGIMGLFASNPAPAPLVPPAAAAVPAAAVPAAAVAPLVPAQLVQEQVPSVLERARAEEMEKQNRRVEERTRELQPQEKQIIGDRQIAQGIENVQDRMKDRQINRDEQTARDVQRGEMFKELQQRVTDRGGKKTRKSKKRGGNNKSKRRGKNKKHLPKKK